MRALPNFPGGNNGFATGANNLGQAVGWAETGFHDPTCCCQSEPGHQVLQFLPAVWDLGSGDQIQGPTRLGETDRKSTRLNSSHLGISYAVFCLKKKKTDKNDSRHTAQDKHARD